MKRWGTISVLAEGGGASECKWSGCVYSLHCGTQPSFIPRIFPRFFATKTREFEPNIVTLLPVPQIIAGRTVCASVAPLLTAFWMFNRPLKPGRVAALVVCICRTKLWRRSLSLSADCFDQPFRSIRDNASETTCCQRDTVANQSLQPRDSKRNEKTTNYEQNVSVTLNVATFLFIQKDSLLRRCTNGWAKWRDARINVAPFSKLFSLSILSCHRWKVKFSSSKKMIGRSSILSIFLVNIFVFTILAETKEKCTFVLL